MGRKVDTQFLKPKQGYIEVICGCMYSGKTEELIRQIKRCEYAKQNYLVFKPKIDNRYSETEVTSHNRDSVNAIVIESASDIFNYLNIDTKVVGIDEAQFFSDEVVEVASKLAEHGRRVIVAGLDTDWKGVPFGPMPDLLAIAEVVKKQYAICMSCGDSATRTQRLVNNTSKILVGSDNMYEARCRACHQIEFNESMVKPSENQIQA